MIHPQKIISHGTMCLLMAIWIAGVGAPGLTASNREQNEHAAGFKEFADRVQDYVKLHKAAESTLPPLKPAGLPELVAAHQQALARKIREARPQAGPGDIFTPKAREAFQHAIQGEFHSSRALNIHATLKQGPLVKGVHVRVNTVYPDGLAHTTVPPTLLLRFPKLPAELAYGIVGPDLILLDVKADLVVDVAAGLIPQATEE